MSALPFGIDTWYVEIGYNSRRGCAGLKSIGYYGYLFSYGAIIRDQYPSTAVRGD